MQSKKEMPLEHKPILTIFIYGGNGACNIWNLLFGYFS